MFGNFSLRTLCGTESRNSGTREYHLWRGLPGPREICHNQFQIRQL